MGKLNLGILTVQQDAENKNDGSTYVAVARSRYSINDNGYIGAIITSGNPTSDQQDLLVGLDARQRYTLDNGLLFESNAWWQTVDNVDGSNTDKSAYGVEIILPNDKLWANLNYKVIEENFNPSLGFVNRKNIKTIDSEVFYRNRLNNNFFKSIKSRIIYNYTSNIDGLKLSELKKWRPIEVNFANSDYANIAYINRFERVQSTFSLAGEVNILPGDYNFDRYSVFYESNDSRSFYGHIWYETGDYFNGVREDYKVGFTAKPNKHAYFEVEYEINKMNFNSKKFDTKTITLNVNFAMNAFWSWTNNIQYNNVSDQAGLFSRLKYEPKAGEVYQLMVSRSYEVEGELSRFHTQTQEIALKGVYSIRF